MYIANQQNSLFTNEAEATEPGEWKPTITILTGDAQVVAAKLATDGERYHASLSDPPYGLGFMAKGWDREVPAPDLWKEVLNTLHPGAYVLAFGGTRKWHHLALALEDAGAEMRDTLMWLYGTGFPKNHDISKAIDKAAGAEREKVLATGGLHNNANLNDDGWLKVGAKAPMMDSKEPVTPGAARWQGYGTALKPAWEPALLFQKPREKTYAHNALTHGCGGLAIDASRIEVGGARPKRESTGQTGAVYGAGLGGSRAIGTTTQGRWPANVILDEEAAAVLDAQSSPKMHGAGASRDGSAANVSASYDASGFELPPNRNMRRLGDSGGASRFFYCAKASRKEREAGLEDFEASNVNDGRETSIDNAYQRGDTKRRNTHPTVKPLDLIRYLAGLMLPPPFEDGSPRKIIVPFSGSGSEVIACAQAGWDHVTGIELNPEYVEIARARITHWIEAGDLPHELL